MKNKIHTLINTCKNKITQKKTGKRADKHILTLHINHQGQQKTIQLGRNHAIALCTAVVVAASGAIYTANAYQNTKAELAASQEQLLESERTNRELEEKAEQLQHENTEYTENITEIQNKTTELEQKMKELETVKEDLHDQLNNLSASADSAELCAAVSAALDASTESASFTNIVSTSYHKASALSTQLDKMNVLLDETGNSFTSVADEVTVALAEYNNVPGGYPVASSIITTEFNPTGDASISDGRKHKGIDISTRGRILPITATASGTVVTSEYHKDFGYYVVIDHGNGFTTLYAHNSELLVNVGDKVKKGETIAMAGSTGMSSGVHCHYEIQLNGVYQDPRYYM